MATIIRVEPFGIGLPLRKPMRLASETIVVAENLFVRVTSSDGLVGWASLRISAGFLGGPPGTPIVAVIAEIGFRVVRQFE